MTTRLGSKSQAATEQGIDKMEANDQAKADFSTVKLFCKIMKKAEEAAQAA